MKNKKSVIRYVIIINLSLVLFYLGVYCAFTILYKNKIENERLNFSTTILDKCCDNFENELNRLDCLMSLCIEDSSFVLSISNKLDHQFFMKNADDTSRKLSIIKNSLPYATNVFAYSKKTDTIIRHNFGVIDKKTFIDNVLSGKKPFELDFKNIKDGFYNMGSYVLYVKNLYSHGFIAIKLNMNEFANINKSIDNGYNFIVTDKNNEIFMKSNSFEINQSEVNNLLQKQKVKIGNTQYFSLKKPIKASKYNAIILTDNETFKDSFRYFWIVGGVSLIILIISFFLMIYLNIKIYMPLRNFTTSFGNSKNTNEISFIENKIHELLHEIYTLSEQNTNPKSALPEKIILHYLIYGGKQFKDVDINNIKQKYTYYHIVCLIIQNDKGQPEPLYTVSLEKRLIENFNMQFINIDKFTNAIVVTDCRVEKIISFLIDFFKTAPNSIKSYIGINQNCADIMDLNTEYKLSFNNLMASKLNMNDTLTYDENATISIKNGLKSNYQNMLYEHAENGTLDNVNELIYNILFEQKNLTLNNFIELYKDIINVIKHIVDSKNIKLYKDFNVNNVYNTNYMYDCLCSYFAQVMRTPINQSSSIRKKIIVYIRDNLSSNLSLESVADEFSITSVYLSSWFKKEFSINFSSYVSNLRMEEATKILKKSHSIKIYELSKKVGIENTATFIRQFKRYTGVTPEQYRKNLKDDVN